jgi:methylase of polypeptide subunit release factors
MEIVSSVVSGGLLKAGGSIVLEVHKGIAEQVANVLALAGFVRVETRRDKMGCVRVVRGSWPGDICVVESIGYDLEALGIT